MPSRITLDKTVPLGYLLRLPESRRILLTIAGGTVNYTGLAIQRRSRIRGSGMARSGGLFVTIMVVACSASLFSAADAPKPGVDRSPRRPDVRGST